MIDSNNINSLIGATAYGNGDDKIGTVGQVYVDSDTQQPSWVTIRTGLFGSSQSFAPLTDASWDNESLRVPFDKEFVKDAPRIEDDGALSPEDEDALYRYYGHGDSGVGTATYADTTRTDATIDVDHDGTVGHDTSGSTTDDAMTRSEERLNVGTQRVEAGRARLRKHIVTENETVVVPVSHEEVRLEREPITDANIGDATSGPAISEEEHEVILTEERPVIAKETVPVERVRLDKQTVTEQERVTEEVRKEEIDYVDGDVDGRPTR